MLTNNMHPTKKINNAGGVDPLVPLWQLQFAGHGKAHFAFKLLAVAQAALQEHPDGQVRSLRDVETTLVTRLVMGGPPPSGPSDPDQVGVLDRQLVLYCGGATPAAALDLAHFILQYKIRKGALLKLPDLQVVHVAGRSAAFALPEPWRLVDMGGVEVPKPFTVLPPRGRRHVLAQLERGPSEEKGEEGLQSKYTMTFFGGIYHFRAAFDSNHVAGGFISSGADGDQREYVRYVEFTPEPTAMQGVILVLEEVLKRLPVYFVNMTEPDDEMAAWLRQQPSIVPAEDAFGSAC